MSKLISLTIDGKPVSVPEGTLIVDAAKKVGIDIPVFCYHPKMEPVGMCRMCLVEIGRPVIDRASGQPVLEADGSPRVQFGPKLETACTTPVSEGMVVLGMSPKAKAGRQDIVEFILTSHPLDCPVCDKGGECPLQNLTMAYGPGQSRFLYDDKMHMAKHVPLGELIFLDRERCIQCGRCVRFQEQIADDPVIGFFHRGRSLEIVTYSEPGFDSYFSGNTTDICPVGALTTADFRFGARPWEMLATASICSHCPVGCNLTYNVRREAKTGGELVIKRAMPRQNEAVNEIWICDKGRFAYHYPESSQRLTQPLVRRGEELVPATWEEALDAVSNALGAAGSGTQVLASGRLANEDLFNLRALAAGLGGKASLYSHMAGGELVSRLAPPSGSNLADLGKGDAILVIASDLEEEAPIWWLRVKQAAGRGATLIVVNPRATKLDRYAQHSLRYPYGSEAAAAASLMTAISPKQNFPKAPSARELGSPAEIKAAAEAFAAATNAILFFGSEGLGLAGSQALAQACANLLVATNHAGRVNNGLIGVWPRANDQGAWELGLRPPAELKAALQQTQALYLAGVDLVGDDPSYAEVLKNTGFVVVQELFLTETARLAQVVLPALAPTEREGSYTSGERRVQRFYPAVLVRSQAKADFAISAELCSRLGIQAESQSAARVFTAIADTVASFKGLSYRLLAQVKEQWPVIGRSDLYYGGTSYENKQGLGVPLADGKAPELAWVEAPALDLPDGSLLAVPVTRLYDRGITVLSSPTLQPRIPQPYVLMRSGEVDAPQGATLQLLLGGQEVSAALHFDESVPAGVVLVPRSLGLPIASPAPVAVKVLVER
jgi:NADH-quinone oxidoreductase subunit G